ncbi:T9SS type A sorting domain-containing protein [Parabacteroides sp.]
MKKIFTTITMALCLVAFSFSASAQADAQKKEIQKKVLPAVFEQIKQQTGIDILGWAQPSLTSGFVESLPGFHPENGLRATGTPVEIQPDSITINVEAINPTYGKIAGIVKVAFSNYLEMTLPTEIAGRSVTVQMPKLITVTSSTLGSLAEIEIIKNENANAMLDIDMNITLLSAKAPLLGLTMAQNTTTYAIEAKLEIGEGMKSLWELIGGIMGSTSKLPDLNYLVSIDLAGMMTTGELPMSLYGIPTAAPETKIPMGDAQVALDFSGNMPLKYIGLTSYENGTAKEWNKHWFDMKQATEQDLVLTIDKYAFKDATKADSTFAQAYIITMSDYTKITTPESAAQSVVNRVVSELANEGTVAPYQMTVEVAMDAAHAMKAKIMEVGVVPGMMRSKAGATINIKSYNADGSLKQEMDMIVTALLAESKMSVDVVPAGAQAPIASTYYTSNIFGAITGNEAIHAEGLSVSLTAEGLYIANSGNADYSIVGLNGATVAGGRIAGDNAYISTASLPKGVYVLVVTANGASQSVKFVR